MNIPRYFAPPTQYSTRRDFLRRATQHGLALSSVGLAASLIEPRKEQA